MFYCLYFLWNNVDFTRDYLPLGVGVPFIFLKGGPPVIWGLKMNTPGIIIITWPIYILWESRFWWTTDLMSQEEIRAKYFKN
jgi:hypothetical protein